MKRIVTSCSMTNLSNGTSCSMTNLHEEVLLHIASFLDIFHLFQMAHVSKDFKQLLYTEGLQSSIDKYVYNIKQLMISNFPFIKRINTDGVVYGECEQCFKKSLLYTQFDGVNERCICLDNCISYCRTCDSWYRFHNNNGFHNCRRRTILL
jgi:hypothetical protein